MAEVAPLPTDSQEIELFIPEQASSSKEDGSLKIRPATAADHEGEEEEVEFPHALTTSSRNNRRTTKKLVTLTPLIFIIFFEVAGGAYGMEPVASSVGPLLGILGFIVFPALCCFPEAAVAAELATTMPGNGGYVLWADRTFGRYVGHLMGTWKFLSSAINAASYPSLCSSYLSGVFPSVGGGRPERLMIVGMILTPTFINLIGVVFVGYAAVALAVLSQLPLLVMCAAAVPELRPRRWVAPVKKKDWRLYVNTLFWNLNYWDNASTFVEEVEKPHVTFPRALLGAGVVTVVSYILPMIMAVGALGVGPDKWVNGFLSEAGDMIAGRWLKVWIDGGDVMSSTGMYEAQLSSNSYLILGMADNGFLPTFFRSKSKWFNTPWVAIIFSTSVTLSISFLTFGDIVSCANVFYGLSIFLEFAVFIWLRIKQPNLRRPYRVPLSVPPAAAHYVWSPPAFSSFSWFPRAGECTPLLLFRRW